MKKLDVNICLSLVTVPFLLGYLTLRTAAKALEQMGENSEEMLRGDRLPLLNFPAEEQLGQQ
jgi:hypothetical protein